MPRKIGDLVGKRFGRLTVIYLVQIEGEHRKKAYCRCDCGKEKAIAISSLKSGCTASCGCLFIEAIKKSNSTHGMTGTRLHNTWRSMKVRCNIASDYHYKFYGGRGIKICEEWNSDFVPFFNWAMSNGYKDDLSIDRIDPNGNYEPSNCRWENKGTQARNRRTRCTSGTGVTGVHKRTDRENDSYRVSIRAAGKNINIGSFATLAAAAEARRRAELKYWGFSLAKQED